MTKPRIVKETRRAVDEVAPPKELQPHEWLAEDSLELYRHVLDAGAPFEVYMSSAAERKIRTHASRSADSRLEVMGLLLGEVRIWKGRQYSLIRDVATTDLQSSSSKVRFDPQGFPRLFGGLDRSGFDYIIVGWYHSHPGHTCFLSRTDIETQRTMFDQPYHTAVVMDPVNREVRAFRLADSGYEEVPFAIFPVPRASKSRGNGRGTRTRRLKVATAVSPR